MVYKNDGISITLFTVLDYLYHTRLYTLVRLLNLRLSRYTPIRIDLDFIQDIRIRNLLYASAVVDSRSNSYGKKSIQKNSI